MTQPPGDRPLRPEPQWYLVPHKKKRKWPWVAAAAACLVIVGAVAVSTDRDHTVGTASAASVRTTTTTSKTTTTTRTTTTTTKPPPPPPSVFNGKGDDVVTLDRPAGLKIVKFECPACTGNTVVRTDGYESLLVNEIGAYSGQRWLDMSDGGKTSTLTVTATGNWTLTVGDIDMATVATGPVSGKGDAVVLLGGSSTKAKITNVGESNFMVHVVSVNASRMNLAVNTIGGYEGTVPLAGPALIQITSSGSWSITPS